MVSAARKGLTTYQVKETSLLGHASSSISQSNIISGHTDFHLCTQGLCALSLLPSLGPGEQRQSPGTLYLYSSFGQGLLE